MIRYKLENIRALLTEGFTDEELRRLCYDVPNFRPVYNQLAWNTGKAEIVDRLLEYSEQKKQLDALLELIKERNPARFEEHQPYHEHTPAPATSGDVSQKSQPEVKSVMSQSINQCANPTYHWHHYRFAQRIRRC